MGKFVELVESKLSIPYTREGLWKLCLLFISMVIIQGSQKKRVAVVILSKTYGNYTPSWQLALHLCRQWREPWMPHSSRGNPLFRAHSSGAVEYTNCISAEEVRSPSPNECPVYDIRPSKDEAQLARSGSTWKGPVYGSNRTVWHLNWK